MKYKYGYIVALRMGLLVYGEAPAKKMTIPSAEYVESLNVAELISFLQEHNLGLLQLTTDKFQTENINGKAFLLLTKQELKDELKLSVGDYLKIEDFIKRLKSQEEDEALLEDFDSLNISDISTVAKDASTATLSQMCKDGIIKKDDRLYYRGDLKPSGRSLFTVSQLCRVVHADVVSGKMMVTAVKDKLEKKSETFESLKALEDWILKLHGIDKNDRKDTSKKFFLIRPLGTLYDLK